MNKRNWGNQETKISRKGNQETTEQKKLGRPINKRKFKKVKIRNNGNQENQKFKETKKPGKQINQGY